jgi:hypothetical protein
LKFLFPLIFRLQPVRKKNNCIQAFEIFLKIPVRRGSAINPIIQIINATGSSVIIKTSNAQDANILANRFFKIIFLNGIKVSSQ